MADEIISIWDDIGQFRDELVSTEEGDRKTKLLIEEINPPLRMNFRLQDGNGNPVVWPLTLISDTTSDQLSVS